MSLLDQMQPGQVWEAGLLARMLPGAAPDPIISATAGIPVEMGFAFVPVPGPRGLPGEALTSLAWSQVLDKPVAFVPTTYTHTQGVAAAVWHIVHNLGRVPRWTVQDSSGRVIHPGERLIDLNTYEFTFGAATSGVAYGS